MLFNLRNFFTAWQMRRLIKSATEAIYIEQFDFDTLVKHLTDRYPKTNLLRIYYAIQFGADTKLGTEDLLRNWGKLLL